MNFAPQLKRFYRGSANFEAALIDDLGPAHIAIHDTAYGDSPTSHLFWSISDCTRLSSTVDRQSRVYNSQEIELRFRADFPLIDGVEIPLTVERVLVAGSADQIVSESQPEASIPVFTTELWEGDAYLCGSHDASPVLTLFDDAIILQFESNYDLTWYGKNAGILLDQDKRLIGVAYRNLSLDIKALLRGYGRR